MKWQQPYINGRSTKRSIFGKPGIYFIREKNTKEIVYIGMSQSNCWKALYRHFQQWSDRISRVVYLNRDNYEVRCIVCTSFQAYKWERILINKHRPKDNTILYDNIEEYDFDINKDSFFCIREIENCPF